MHATLLMALCTVQTLLSYRCRIKDMTGHGSQVPGQRLIVLTC